MSKLITRLQERKVLVADGATGTRNGRGPSGTRDARGGRGLGPGV